MEKKRIEKEYKKLVDNIESLRMYDGRGTVDRYVCEKCDIRYSQHTEIRVLLRLP